MFFFLVFLFCFLPLLSHWLDQTYGYIDLDAVVYTITAPTTNTPRYIYLGIAKTVLLGLGAGLLLFLVLRFAFSKLDGSAAELILIVLVCLAGLGSVSYFLIHHDFGSLLNSRCRSDFIRRNYYAPPLTGVTFPHGKPNVIYLMLESMEWTFNQLPEQDRLLPELEKISLANLSFYGQGQAIGTSWTIAAQTAHFFGLPLKTPHFANIYDHGADSFLPGAVSIFELLEANGYAIATIMGSAGDFAGTGLMMDSHAPAGKMHDYAVINAAVQGDPLCQGDWGLRDSCVYAYARSELLRMAGQDQPFFAIIATIDTHNGHGPLTGQAAAYGDDRDNFLLADRQAGDFLAWLEKQPFFADTVVVVLGDHEYMSNKIGPFDLRQTERSTYNALINARRKVPLSVNRRFSALDWAPTILEAMGAEWEARRFGLGVSLYAGQPTLVEQYGFAALNLELGKRSSLYQEFFVPR